MSKRFLRWHWSSQSTTMQ